MNALPRDFLTIPLAHRALHDVGAGRPENSRAAMRAAIAAGYGIELDVQLSQDGQAMVFHDYHLARLTAQSGPIRLRHAEELGGIALHGGDDGIPTLAEVLDIVEGAVPVLIEIKDQDGALGPDVGPLERAVAAAVAGYAGPVAVMSFNPHSIALCAELSPDLPRGLTTCDFAPKDWNGVAEVVLDQLRGIPDYERVGASFVSHQSDDLDRPRVSQIKAAGGGVLCWTIRSTEAEAAARRIADNITFEGYLAALPPA